MVNAKVTVVMPVYNAEKYLAEAVDSILNQTFQEWVLFVIDDGSTDSSPEILKRLSLQDNRVQFFQQENRGLIATLNQYCSLVVTPFLARMDSDDISYPDRLERQVRFLESNEHIGIVGTAVRYLDEAGRILSETKFPVSHALIQWNMLYTTGISHPSMMMRTEVFRRAGGYANEARHVEDYDFFLRAMNVTILANLSDVLFGYRKNTEGVSHTFRDEQAENHFGLSKQYIQTFNCRHYCDEGVHFLKYNTLLNPTLGYKIYSFIEELGEAFLKKTLPSISERTEIRRDQARLLSILSLTYKNYSFWPGCWLYIRTLIKAPWVVLYNINNRDA